MVTDTEATIAELIRRAHTAGEGGYKTLAKRFGVSPRRVQNIITQRPSKSATQRGRRSCPRKVRHETEAAAQSALARLVSPDNSRPLRVYRCPACGGFHVGHDWRLSARRKP